MFTRVASLLICLLLVTGVWPGFAPRRMAVAQADAPVKQASSNDQSVLRINEIMADNVSVLQDPEEPGEFPDWVELYNPSPDNLSLDGLFLSDDPALPTKFAIPSGLIVPAHDFILFYADDDGKQGPHHLNFKLSAAGEFIGLFDAQGATTIDSYTFGPQTPDVSIGRQPDGSDNWHFIAKPTPGKRNVALAPAILSVQRTPAQPAANTPVTVMAVITADGAVAATLYYSATGQFQSLPMALVGNSYQAQIPGQPDNTLIEYYVSAKDSNNQTTVSPALAPADAYRYLVGYQPPTLVINEVMANNQGGLEDPNEPGTFPDWIELYNFGANPVSLDNLYLTDDVDKPTRFPIPSGIIIPPNQYLLFFADSSPQQGQQHTNFGLNHSGDFVGLYGARGSFAIDTLTFGEQLPDLAYGRYPNGTGSLQTLFCPTPLSTNLACAQYLYLPTIHR
mgnify:CR=1 FL=1